MEGKKSSFVDELFPRYDSASPTKSDFLSSIFPPSGAGKGSSHYESPAAMAGRKQGNEGGSSNGSASKSQNASKKNSNHPIVLCEIAEPCLMSSSVYYGGRDDFIPENSSSHSSGSGSYRYKNDSEDDKHVATRGEWWQGSLYY
ncbi:hypothetical protein AXF42_Ash014923 [Apostasia shenzhenica]|uniref:Uncharacterized protein n=1 Tax=Apostasia shenzhenica TaxID=1088818 RepID=A0A2I0ALJ8_9ASPA|nr:hypothetical protein AXF42_Ash014923 [Apostasia shenzhenica]